MKNLIGQKFDKLTVTSYAGKHNNRTAWNCRCDCGNMIITLGNTLKNKARTSCGCKRIKNLIGKKFGKLTVVSKDIKKIKKNGEKMKYTGASWKCQCYCGKEISVIGQNLRNGKTRSCGCSNHTKLNIGDRFNDLTVINDFVGIINNQYICKCKCSCGKEVDVIITRLINGVKKSCGCFLRRRKKNSPIFTGHEDIYGEFWGHIKDGAKRRNIPFKITIKQAWGLFIKQNRKCALSGISIKFHSSSRVWDGNASLDRIDSSKDYSIDNVQWVHKDINWMKQDYSQKEFINYCKLIANYNK